MKRFGLFVAGRPVPQGSLRHVGRGKLVHDNAKLKAWREAIGWSLRAAHAPMSEAGAVTLRCDFNVHPLRQGDAPDLDKLLRAVLDALSGVVYADDKQVVELAARRTLDSAKREGVQLAVEVSPFASEAKAKRGQKPNENLNV